MSVIRNVKVKRIILALLVGVVFVYQYANVAIVDRRYSSSNPVQLPERQSEHRLALIQIHTNVSFNANNLVPSTGTQDPTEVGLEGVKNDDGRDTSTSLQPQSGNQTVSLLKTHVQTERNESPTNPFPPHARELSKAQVDLHSNNKPIDSSLALQWIQGNQYLDQRIKQLYMSCHATVLRDSHGVFGQCKNFSDMRFIDGSRVVALPSFPGSGNTWTRMALEQATGVYTGSVYCDPELKSKGLLGEKLSSSNVLAVKTHYPDKDLFVPYEEYHDLSKFKNVTAAIFIIRNPLDSFVAQWSWKHGGHISHVQPSFFGMYICTMLLCHWGGLCK